MAGGGYKELGAVACQCHSQDGAGNFPEPSLLMHAQPAAAAGTQQAPARRAQTQAGSAQQAAAPTCRRMSCTTPTSVLTSTWRRIVRSVSTSSCGSRWMPTHTPAGWARGQGAEEGQAARWHYGQADTDSGAMSGLGSKGNAHSRQKA